MTSQNESNTFSVSVSQISELAKRYNVKDKVTELFIHCVCPQWLRVPSRLLNYL
jgi:hypothetical protein